LPAGPQEQEIYEAAPIAALLHIPRSQAEDILAACKDYVAQLQEATIKLRAGLQEGGMSDTGQNTAAETQGSSQKGVSQEEVSATAQLADQLFDDEYSFEEGEESLAAEEEPPYGE
ncbi:MAG: hypothetical protein J6K76_00005, partial [Spirochaetaceae bacterium]|nr:hypothetical protein [Spirochaetaceae bacterium]